MEESMDIKKLNVKFFLPKPDWDKEMLFKQLGAAKLSTTSKILQRDSSNISVNISRQIHRTYKNLIKFFEGDEELVYKASGIFRLDKGGDFQIDVEIFREFFNKQPRFHYKKISDSPTPWPQHKAPFDACGFFYLKEMCEHLFESGHPWNYNHFRNKASQFFPKLSRVESKKMIFDNGYFEHEEMGIVKDIFGSLFVRVDVFSRYCQKV